MVIQKMSELVTSDSPIDDLDDESSEGQQGPLSSISENPASPMTSLGNEADEEEKEISEGFEADARNANYVNVEFQRSQELDSENNVPVSFFFDCTHWNLNKNPLDIGLTSNYTSLLANKYCHLSILLYWKTHQ